MSFEANRFGLPGRKSQLEKQSVRARDSLRNRPYERVEQARAAVRRARTTAPTTNEGFFGRPRDLFDRRPGRTHEARVARLILKETSHEFTYPNPTRAQTVPQDQPVPQQDTDRQTIVRHLGPAFRITPIGSGRFRCNKYARPSARSPTGRLTETFVLRVNSNGIEKLSDHQSGSNRTRPW